MITLKKFWAAVTIILLIAGSTFPVMTKEDEPPLNQTGAPLEATCGNNDSDCHNVDPNLGPGNITISFSDINNTYVPGNMYQVTFTVNESPKIRFGFEATSLNSSNQKAGTWQIIDAATTTLQMDNSPLRDYVGHKDANLHDNVNSWTVNWTAPNPGVGNVTIYAAGNAADNDGEETGDNIYSTSLVLTGPVGIESIPAVTDFNLNTIGSDEIQLSFSLRANEQVSISLFSLDGKLARHLMKGTVYAGTHHMEFPLHGLPAGLYLLEFKTQNYRQAQKFVAAQ